MKLTFTASSFVITTELQVIEIRYADFISAFMKSSDHMRAEVGRYVKGYLQGVAK